MSDSVLSRRREELGLDDQTVAQWEAQVAPDVVAAVLASLIRFEDALAELSR
ncbi:MAG: hypothetical protein JOY68_01035 [Candidatus Dormibacteraeota bacterium]|nr:hypothetical protein [Candidatus Dormibacteraeota bacterium]MBV8444360.1 hypothetical protein [Candidatus Dormibacteraeota bacterium]